MKRTETIFSIAHRFIFKSEEGASALEFALVAPVFLSFICGIIGHAYVSFQLNHLDYSTYRAGASIRIQNLDADSLEAFQKEVVCPTASLVLNCDALELGIESSPSFAALSTWQASNIIGSFCPGEAGDIVAISARYKINDALKAFYFGFSDAGNDREMYLKSRYIIVREPIITDTKKC